MFHSTFKSFKRHHSSLNSNLVTEILSPDIVLDTISSLGLAYRKRIFCPFVTLFALISRCLSDDGSYRSSIVNLFLSKTLNRQFSHSPGTGSLSKAKSRLPVEFFSSISQMISSKIQKTSNSLWEWEHGPVKVVDGTCFSMADTIENTKKFNKQTSYNRYSQKYQSQGFPIGRALAVFCLSTGAIKGLEISPYKGKGSGEKSLLKKLWACFKKGDTFLADALFSDYLTIATAVKNKVRLVSEFPKKSIGRINQRKNDQIIEIRKPNQKPISVDEDEFNSLPDTLKVRIVKIKCSPKGFRPKTKWLVTTFLDSELVTADSICQLYRQRWQAELNFRSIKTIMGMDFINAKTPSSVEKDIWLYIISYNIVRIYMIQAGIKSKNCPTQLSFRAAQQIIAVNRIISIKTNIETITNFINSNQVGNRPDRFEPRALKKRPKNFALLSEDRNLARKRLHKKFKKKPIP